MECAIRYMTLSVTSPHLAVAYSRHKSHKIMALQLITHRYIRLDENMNTLILTHASKN